MSERGGGPAADSRGAGRVAASPGQALARMISAGAIIALCVVAEWGRWDRVAIMVGTTAILAPLNWLFIRWSLRPGAAHRIDRIKSVTNLAGMALTGHFCGWPLPLWLYLPLNAVWLDAVGWGARWNLVVHVVAVSAVAFYDGVPPITFLSFDLLTLAVFAISQERGQVMRAHAEELASTSRDLEEGQAVAHLGSWSFDVVHNSVVWSAELYRIFGVDPTSFGSTLESYLHCVHPDDRGLVQSVSERALVDHQPFAYEHRVARPDGEVRWVHSSGRVRTDDAGRPLKVSGAAHDITERKQLQAQLVLADRLASLGTLAGGVGHEINNPLTYVMTNLDYLGDELVQLANQAGAPRLSELIEVTTEARQGAERIRRIVRDLRQFASADEDNGGVTDVHEALDFSIKMAWNEIRHRARLVKRYGELPLVRAGETRLGQVFLNLLVNAAQSISEGPVDLHEIRVITSTDPSGAAVVEVQDTGAGMSPEVQRLISIRSSPPSRWAPARASGCRSVTASSLRSAARSRCTASRVAAARFAW